MASFQRVKVRGGFHTRAQVRRAGRSWSRTCKTKAAARKWALALEADLAAGVSPGGGSYLLSEMVDRYARTVLVDQRSGSLTHKRLLAWIRMLGDRPLSEVVPRDIADARDALAADLATSTVRRYLSALSSAFNRAIKDWQWLSVNPCRSIIWPKEPRGRVRYLDDAELGALRDACRGRSSSLADLVDLALMTGMRRGELLGLTWGSIDWSHARILLLNTKNDERRQVPLTPAGLAVLQRRCPPGWTRSMFIFCRRGDPEKPADLRRVWLSALQDAGVSNFRFHDLRHTAASYLAMTGATSNQIAEILGHKSLAMVKRYAHLSVENQAEALGKLSARLGA